MADVFNNNPSSFVDLNELFVALNDKVGLTSTQFRKLVENTNYLKNNLGLANVEVGTVQTIFTQPGTFADVQVSHRSAVINGLPMDYFDYTFYVPTPKIETELNSKTSSAESEIGMNVTQTPIYGTGANSSVVIGYKFSFNATLPEQQDVSGKEDISNKVAEISQNSTNTQYPSAKAVYTLFNSIVNGNEVEY